MGRIIRTKPLGSFFLAQSCHFVATTPRFSCREIALAGRQADAEGGEVQIIPVKSSVSASSGNSSGSCSFGSSSNSSSSSSSFGCGLSSNSSCFFFLFFFFLHFLLFFLVLLLSPGPGANFLCKLLSSTTGGDGSAQFGPRDCQCSSSNYFRRSLECWAIKDCGMTKVPSQEG